MTWKCISIFIIFLKVLQLFEWRRGYLYLTANKNFVRSPVKRTGRFSFVKSMFLKKIISLKLVCAYTYFPIFFVLSIQMTCIDFNTKYTKEICSLGLRRGFWIRYVILIINNTPWFMVIVSSKYYYHIKINNTITYKDK